jgi:hypothetical protein
MRQADKSRRVATVTTAKSVEAAMNLFQIDCGRLPTNDEGIGALLDDPGIAGWNGHICRSRRSMVGAARSSTQRPASISRGSSMSHRPAPTGCRARRTTLATGGPLSCRPLPSRVVSARAQRCRRSPAARKAARWLLQAFTDDLMFLSNQKKDWDRAGTVQFAFFR